MTYGELSYRATKLYTKGKITLDKYMEMTKPLNREIEQEPKTGHWFVDERPESDREIICSNCEQPIFRYHKLDFDYRPKYCPNCGAKMKSEDDNGSSK